MSTQFVELLAGLPDSKLLFIRQACDKALSIPRAASNGEQWKDELKATEATRQVAEKVMHESLAKRNKLIRLLGKNTQMSSDSIAEIVGLKPRNVRRIING